MNKKLISFILIFCLILVTGCSNTQVPTTDSPVVVNKPTVIDTTEKNTKEITEPTKNEEIVTSGDLKIHYIDVGQADSILIQFNDKNMLIDAGNLGDKETLSNYFTQNGIKNFEYVVATHPHEDHIGAMAYVLSNYNVNKILLSNGMSNTKTFENMLLAIQNKDINRELIKAGYTFGFEGLKMEVLAPNSDNYEDINDYSVVLKLTYKENAFLFTGDAEELSENEMLNRKFNVSANVLKVGHHGSNSSSSYTFLKKVNPQYAVISVGKDNDYGHPKPEIISRYDELGIKVLRTDELGTIVLTSDGKNISFNKSTISKPIKIIATPITPKAENELFIGNKNSKIFHTTTCGNLPLPKNQVKFSSKEEAINNGYRPAKDCNP